MDKMNFPSILWIFLTHPSDEEVKRKRRESGRRPREHSNCSIQLEQPDLNRWLSQSGLKLAAHPALC